MSKELDEPAFPFELSNRSLTETMIGAANDLLPPMTKTTYSGMTLRDYFAAKAMQSLFAATYKDLLDAGYSTDNSAKLIVHSAYGVADAMLVERNK